MAQFPTIRNVGSNSLKSCCKPQLPCRWALVSSTALLARPGAGFVGALPRWRCALLVGAEVGPITNHARGAQTTHRSSRSARCDLARQSTRTCTITAGLCAFSSSSTVTERDDDPRNLRGSLDVSAWLTVVTSVQY